MIRADRLSMEASTDAASNDASKLLDLNLTKDDIIESDILERNTELNKRLLDPHKASNEDFLDPYSPGNIGIFASYLAVGFGMYFILTPLSYYMVDDLDSSAAQQSCVLGLLSLPWALKICCGFLTDSVPIQGLRRKPYFIIGWIIYGVCNAVLAIFGKPSIAVLAVFTFAMTMGFVQADVSME